MVDEKMEHIYNIILSIFCGIFFVIIFDNFFNKPVTDIYFVVRRTDMEEVNQWANFTNYPDFINQIPPYTRNFNNEYGSNITINRYNISTYKTPYLVKSARILIEGQDIMNGRVFNFDNGDSTLTGKDNFYLKDVMRAL